MLANKFFEPDDYNCCSQNYSIFTKQWHILTTLIKTTFRNDVKDEINNTSYALDTLRINCLIIWCLRPSLIVIQLYRGGQCTYPCFPRVLLISREE